MLTRGRPRRPERSARAKRNVDQSQRPPVEDTGVSRNPAHDDTAVAYLQSCPLRILLKCLPDLADEIARGKQHERT